MVKWSSWQRWKLNKQLVAIKDWNKFLGIVENKLNQKEMTHSQDKPT